MSDNDSEIDMNTPPDIVNAATNATNNLLPQKSRAKYEKGYKDLLHYTASYTIHDIAHCQQQSHWDCGIACVMMLLSAEQRQCFQSHLTQICAEEGLHKSTWTIDLCYLLRRFNIHHEMYTSMPGVNEGFKKHNYYKNVIDKDRARVEARFKEAHLHQINVKDHTLGMPWLLDHLALGPVIMLVDAGLLVCDLCKHNKLKAEFRSCFGSSYKGHYILLVGRTPTKVVYRDPTLRSRLCVASPARLERAGAASGTDDDCILVLPSTR